ncbi:hypothetical protein BS78_07G153800 [Paspalum vaginatum]|nr:hypothetical protein BS78_07G153800 [Paspalum vaginatum]
MAAECGEGKQADCKKTPWTAAEDEALRRAVREHGRQNWAAIAGEVAGRGAKSCRLRWFQHLAPGLDSRPFTPEEDVRIVEQQRVHGNRWATIARYLHGRSDNAIKNRWNSALRKMQQRKPAASATEEDADGLAAAPACLDLFPRKARAIGEDAAADRLAAREESDVASIGLKLGLSPRLSDAELALSLGPVRPSSNRGEVASFRPPL